MRIVIALAVLTFVVSLTIALYSFGNVFDGFNGITLGKSFTAESVNSTPPKTLLEFFGSMLTCNSFTNFNILNVFTINIYCFLSRKLLGLSSYGSNNSCKLFANENSCISTSWWIFITIER